MCVISVICQEGQGTDLIVCRVPVLNIEKESMGFFGS